MPRRLSPVALLTLVLSACDGTGPPVVLGDGAAPDGAAGVVAELAAAVARATCEKVDLCCSPMERMRVIGVGEDRATCETSLGAFYGRQYGAAAASVASGRTVLDPEELRRCVEAYRASGCVAPGLAARPACLRALVGVLPNDAPCDNGFECASRHCNLQSGERVCRPRKADGEACTRSNECTSGFCSTRFLGGTCSSEPPMGPSCGGDGFWMDL